MAGLVLMIGIASCSRGGNKDADSAVPGEVAETASAASSSDSVNDPLAEVGKGKPSVIDFYATWCGPCKMIAPVFRQLEEKYSQDVAFTLVDVDQYPDIAMKYSVEAMPTFVFLDSAGKEIDRIVGADAEGLQRKVLELAGK